MNSFCCRGERKTNVASWSPAQLYFYNECPRHTLKCEVYVVFSEIVLLKAFHIFTSVG